MCPFEIYTNNCRITKEGKYRESPWYLRYKCNTGVPSVQIRCKTFHTSDEAYAFYLKLVKMGQWPVDDPIAHWKYQV